MSAVKATTSQEGAGTEAVFATDGTCCIVCRSAEAMHSTTSSVGRARKPAPNG